MMHEFRDDDFSRLELSFPAAERNYRYFRSLLEPSTRMLVLVKANAYGLGAVEFSSMMQRLGANYLAVAHPVEGIELRSHGISLPIIVLTSGTDYFSEIIEYHLEPSLPNLSSIEVFSKALRAAGKKDWPVHIKFDTGMHRLGFTEDEIAPLSEYLGKCPEIKVKSCFSHLAASEDSSQDEFTLSQIDLFTSMYGQLCSAIGYKPLRHILNSAGIERFPRFQFDMVRLGIGIYGISSLPGVKLSPVASLKCKIIQIKKLDNPSETIGYGRLGKVYPGMTIATIPVGYADGIDRHLGRGKASFLLNGHRVPTVGNICMDMCMLDVTGVNAAVGDTVTIFGDEPSIEELADILGTIPYEILTSVPRRIERIIVRR
ncbi:MAG: alanine racemase [Bacteroidales bacterium]|nr:alanine racemase [Bacteroidales bacterium]